MTQGNEEWLPEERRQIERLLAGRSRESLTVQDMWALMDGAWAECGCDDRTPDEASLLRFYAHPVWTLNGLFIEGHAQSMEHRRKIADWIRAHVGQGGGVLDYGGGFGTLARMVAQASPGIRVDILEPSPARLGVERLRPFPNVRIVSSAKGPYDAVVCLDVLEHVGDPLGETDRLLRVLKDEGSLVMGNAFLPMTKCHLPANLHFLYTFGWFMARLGLRRTDRLEGTHIVVYRIARRTAPDWARLRRWEQWSRRAFPLIGMLRRALKPWGLNYDR